MMWKFRCMLFWLALGTVAMLLPGPVKAGGLQRIKFNNPGLVVDLGVGLVAVPLPMDYDGDGDYDLVVTASQDVPYRGTYLFENPGGEANMPVFKPAVSVGKAHTHIRPSYVDGRVRLLVPAAELVDFRKNRFAKEVKIYPTDLIHPNRCRQRAWHYCDYDSDGALDLIVGVGDWTEYGWADAYNEKGEWVRGPGRGFVYLIRNNGTTAEPVYAEPRKLTAGGKPIEVYAMPSPNFADFDGDGDLDIICGEFLDKMTYFQNTGTRTEPKYTAGRFIEHDGRPIQIDGCMITPVAFDWDKDGDIDLLVGAEDGRVAFVENTGKLLDGVPVFAPPCFFQQEANEVKFGVLVTPVGVDFDGDGDEDLLCGNASGYIGFIENLDGGNPPKWAAPKYLEADGKIIRIQAGYNGSIQGPCEAKWGYTALSVADWDHDGLPDLVVNSIWGKVVWYRNIGTRKSPKFAAAEMIEVQWPGKPPKPAWIWWEPQPKQLATQWRTTPVAIDFNRDGLNDLVMLDHEGYLAFFERKKVDGKLQLMPPERVFRSEGKSVFSWCHGSRGEKTGGLLRLNDATTGLSGRRKLCLADWDGDGRIDLLVNSSNANFLCNVSSRDGIHTFRDMGRIGKRALAGHTTSPTVVDWDKNGVPDLLVGAEDGHLYYLKNPHDKAAAR